MRGHPTRPDTLHSSHLPRAPRRELTLPGPGALRRRQLEGTLERSSNVRLRVAHPLIHALARHPVPLEPMTHPIRIACSLAYASLVAWSAPLVAQETRSASTARVAPFAMELDRGLGSSAELALDARAYADLDRLWHTDSQVSVTGLPLPGGEEVELLLRPTGAMAPDAEGIIVGTDGQESRLTPSVRLFAGSVPGRASTAFLGISPDMVHGYLTLDGETYFLSSGDARASDPLTIAHASAVAQGPAREWCHTLAANPGELNPGQPWSERNGGSQALFPANVVKVADVFMEGDHQFRALFSTDQEALDYIVLLVSASSEIYRRDVAMQLNIPSGYLRIWNTVPPWGTVNTFGDLSKFSGWWSSGANPQSGLKRAAVQLLTNPVFGGVAATVLGTCSKSKGYEVSSVFGSFPYPTQHTNSANWDLIVLSHEFGHTFGSFHTFEMNINCDDGSGPDKGTIMSYCHLTFGVGQIGMRFHAEVQDELISLLGAPACLADVVFELGDYDLSGTLDAADLSALDAYFAQGFESMGAVRAFDFTGDGVLDSFDRDILVSRVNGDPAASSVQRNGSGVNCICFATTTPPLIGGTWSLFVSAFASSSVSTVIVHPTAAIPPVSSAFGEILVSGPRIFADTQPSNGLFAEHFFPVPYDLSLIGFSASSQAIVTGTGPVKLTNALDIVLGLFE